MTTRATWVSVLLLVGLTGAGVVLWRWGTSPVLPEVTLESIQQRDLQQIVSASGKVQPRRQVNVSATTMGRVTRLAVSEGQRVKAGQFLLEIDPRALAGQIERGEASVAAAGIDVASADEDRARRDGGFTIGEVDGVPRGGGSTWQSLERGVGSVEVDTLNGEVVLLGRLHGVPTPVNRTLVACLKGIERGLPA